MEELMNCYICGTTHGFGSRCPSPEERTTNLTRLQQDNARLRAVLLWKVHPYLVGLAQIDKASVLEAVEDVLGLHGE